MANPSRGRKKQMKNELNKNIDCLITKSIIVTSKKILAFHQHMNTYKPKFWRWFAVVCGGLRWFSRFFNGTRSVLYDSGGGLWWFAVVCGGLRWFVVVCGGLWWFVVDCGGLSFSHTGDAVNSFHRDTFSTCRYCACAKQYFTVCIVRCVYRAELILGR